MDDKTKVIDRIKKLLALSASPNEHEAASAAEKAQALLAEHNLSMMDVKSETKNEDSFVIDTDTRSSSSPWRRRLATACATLYFCEYYYTFHYEPTPKRSCGYIRHDIHNFVGAPHNIAVAKMMFVYLTNTVERLAREGAKTVAKGLRSGYETSFKTACTSRVCARIHKRIADAKAGGMIKTEGGTNLPALADLYDRTKMQLQVFLDKQGAKLKTTNLKATLSNSLGARDGAAAGDRIGLDSQVQGKSNHLLR